MWLPAMDGVDLIPRLRAIPQLTNVPMAADVSGKLERRAIQAGMIEVITKLLDLEKLLALMAHCP